LIEHGPLLKFNFVFIPKYRLGLYKSSNVDLESISWIPKPTIILNSEEIHEKINVSQSIIYNWWKFYKLFNKSVWNFVQNSCERI